MKFAVRKVKINTKNMTVVLGGAYTDVYRETKKHDLGFVKDEPVKSQSGNFDTKDFVEYGKMTDEFMSRVTVIQLNSLDAEDIKRIMLESDRSAIKIQKEIFGKLGVKVVFTDGYINKAASNAVQKRTGARGLNGIIDESTWKAFAEVYSHPNLYTKAIFDEGSLEDSENYQLVKKRNISSKKRK